MEYRTLGRTGLSVSELSLGTVELGIDYGIAAPGHAGRPTREESIKLIHRALDAGINFIDTARAYGDSEQIVGLAVNDRRDDVIIATKGEIHTRTASGNLGPPMQGPQLEKSIQTSLETSLNLLQTDYVDIWMLHNVDQSVLEQTKILAELFDALRCSGKVRWIGGTFYGVDAPQVALESDLFDVHQITYSVLDQRVGDCYLEAAQTKNVGVVARSVLLQGVLTTRGDHLPPHLDLLAERSRQFRQLVRKQGDGLTASQAAVTFALANPMIQSVLIGVSSQDELIENLQGLEHSVPRSLLKKMTTLRLDDVELLDPSKW